MTIRVFGISHKTCPIAERERFFLRVPEREILLNRLREDPSVTAALVLSTCNRTEIYAGLIEGAADPLAGHLLQVKGGGDAGRLERRGYRYAGLDAVRHLFRVSSGLDSLILGEKQILGQVKTAVDLARGHRMLDRTFNILLHVAVRAGKKAQHETAISCGGSSVSWAAAAMARRELGRLDDKTVLIIGSGKMGKLAAGHFTEKGFGRILFMNRTIDKARLLAEQYHGEAVPFWDLADVLAGTDVCISSAGAPHYLLEASLVGRVMARRPERRLLLLDIAVPRNIEPAAGEVPGSNLFALDDLEQVLEETAGRRREAVDAVERIVEAKVEEFQAKLAGRRGAPAAPEAGILAGVTD